MKPRYHGFDVTFSVENVTLQEQNQIYQALMKHLPSELKDRLAIEVKDVNGGRHQLLTETGITPEGTKCPLCKTIDCGQCPIWKRIKEKGAEKNGKLPLK